MAVGYRNKVTFVWGEEVIWRINEPVEASVIDIPQKDGFVELPQEVAVNGVPLRWWVRRVDTKYVAAVNPMGPYYATEITVHVEEL